MKDKGNFMSLFSAAILFTILIWVSLAALGNLWHNTAEDCAWNATGSLVNCSLSNNAYTALNQSQGYADIILSVNSTIPLFIGVFAVILALVAYVRE